MYVHTVSREEMGTVSELRGGDGGGFFGTRTKIQVRQ
jgi:hypothetical protein